MQLAVTQCICKGTVLVFRFYPQSDGYQSSSSVTFCFALATDVTTQSTFQLRYNPNTTQIELWVVGVVGYFVIAATPVASQIVPATASCAVFFGSPCVSVVTSSALQLVCAIGLITHSSDDFTDVVTYPILPLPCVLPCQYAYEIDLLYGNIGVQVPSDTEPSKLYVQGTWHMLWQRLKWSDLWVSSPSAASFAVLIQTTAFYIALLPGTFTAILFVPFDITAIPPVPCTWAVVSTAVIPANTHVFLDVHGGDNYLSGSHFMDYKWIAPTYDLPAGTVITFDNLGAGFAARATYGSITKLVDSMGSIDYICAVCAAPDGLTTVASPVFAVGASYDCLYTGPVTPQLIPGRDIRSSPWPDSRSIVLFDTCQRVCDWECQRFLLNRAPLARWVCQPIPSNILSCSPCSKFIACCGSATAPYRK